MERQFGRIRGTRCSVSCKGGNTHLARFPSRLRVKGHVAWRGHHDLPIRKVPTGMYDNVWEFLAAGERPPKKQNKKHRKPVFRWFPSTAAPKGGDTRKCVTKKEDFGTFVTSARLRVPPAHGIRAWLVHLVSPLPIDLEAGQHVYSVSPEGGPGQQEQEILWMDEILHHLRNLGMNDSPVNTNKQWLPMVSKWCRILSIHSITRERERETERGREGGGSGTPWFGCLLYPTSF